MCRRAGSKKGSFSLSFYLALSLSVSLASSSQCVPHPQSQSAYAYACIWVNITAPRANRGQHKKPLLVYVWLGTGSLPLCADRPAVRGGGGRRQRQTNKNRKRGYHKYARSVPCEEGFDSGLRFWALSLDLGLALLALGIGCHLHVDTRSLSG